MLLDNPAWHALRGPQARLAEAAAGGPPCASSPRCRFFAAVDRIDESAWAAQAELVGAGGVAFLFRDRVPAPPGGWKELLRIPTLQLVAGERFRLAGWTEISAVCTHPDARRKGFGAALSLWMARHIRQQGNEALLHVVETNHTALRLYESIGFSVRRKVDVVGAQWIGEG